MAADDWATKSALTDRASGKVVSNGMARSVDDGAKQRDGAVSGDHNGDKKSESPPAPAETAVGRNAELSAEAQTFYARLEQAPWEFDFFHAVRFINCVRSDLPTTGAAMLPSAEAVRFGQEPSLACEGASIASYQPALPPVLGQAARPPRLLVNFLGLMGTNGPMPSHFTQYVRERRNRGDRGLARFLDMFHHRMVSLFYRAWAIHQRTIGFDRPESDPFATFVGSFFGLGSRAVRDRDDVPDVAKYHFTGRLSQQVRCADGLADILTEYFGVPAEIEQFVGQWMEIPEENRCELGRSSEAGSLGVGLLLGTQTYDYQQRIRIRLGPMSLDDYLRFMPNRPSVRRLSAWVHTFCGIEVEWELQLAIAADQVPRPQLGIIGELGWSVWLCGPVKDARDDLVLRLDESSVIGGN